jgi:hypothetical protein
VSVATAYLSYLLRGRTDNKDRFVTISNFSVKFQEVSYISRERPPISARLSSDILYICLQFQHTVSICVFLTECPKAISKTSQKKPKNRHTLSMDARQSLLNYRSVCVTGLDSTRLTLLLLRFAHYSSLHPCTRTRCNRPSYKRLSGRRWSLSILHVERAFGCFVPR